MVTRTGIDFIKEHPPSSRRAASAHRALALDGFDSRDSIYEKSPSPFGEELFFMVKQNLLHPNFLHGWQQTHPSERMYPCHL